MYRIISILLYSFLLGLTSQMDAQKIEPEYLEGIKIRNIGPAGMSGRITAIDVNLANPKIMFVGAASGGVWKSENGGTSWEPIFDDEGTQSIGAIKINQNNPQEVWVGTGEGNPRNSQNSGAGVYRSLDGGSNWTLMGLEKTKVIHRILIDHDNPNIVYVGAQGSAWGDSPDRGVYKTTDSGKSWTKILYLDQKTGIGELVMDPNNPKKLIAAMWEFRRTPYDFTSGGKSSGLYISLDGGETWDKKTDEDGLPKGDLGRLGLAIAASNSNVVYALVEAKENALYKSFDGGTNWTKHSTDDNIGNRPFYYYELYVDPKDENRVYSLWSYVSRSKDGGKTWEVIADYGNAVHPDHHAFWIHPEEPSFILDGNDGGLNISRDGGDTWQFVPNIPVGQFYHVNVDNDYPYNVYGGMQDNGSWVGPAFVLKNGGIRNNDWQELYFGDGFDVSPLPSDSRFGYAMSQGGNMGRYDRVTGRTEFVKPIHPEGKPLRFNWNAAFAQNPKADCGIYYGSQYVHKSMDCGRSWEIISPDLTTNDTLKQKQDKSGGLTIDATNAENNTTIVAIAPSILNDDVIWVGTDDGNIQLTQDGGNTWTLLNNRISGLPKTAWVPQIKVSANNEGEAFVVVNNYRQNDWGAYVYHTSDFGQTWRRIVSNNDVPSFVTCIVQDPVEEKLLFLGTDVGLYYSLNGAKSWSKWSKGFPSVQVRDMVIHPINHDLVLGTFGRAFWVMDDIRPLRALASSGSSQLTKKFASFPAPDAYLTNYRSYDGVRFYAQGEFIGENKRADDAMLTVWKKPQAKKDKSDMAKEKKEDKEEKKDDKKDKKKDKKPDDKLHIKIVDSAGDTIRTFSRKLEKDGMQRVYWNLSKDGVRFPSRREPSKDADNPSGYQVSPGTYKVLMTYNGQKDSTQVTVKLDPRIEVSGSEMSRKAELVKEYESVIEKATEAFTQLKDAKKSLDLIEKIIVNLPDSTKEEMKEMSKMEKEKIDELSELYMEKQGLKGIQRNPNNLRSKLGRAGFYLQSSWDAPGENAMNAFKLMKKQAQDVTSQINEYLSGDWKTYQDKVKGTQFELFKEVKEVIIK